MEGKTTSALILNIVTGPEVKQNKLLARTPRRTPPLPDTRSQLLMNNISFISNTAPPKNGKTH
jgi:hypothetical protein